VSLFQSDAHKTLVVGGGGEIVIGVGGLHGADDGEGGAEAEGLGGFFVFEHLAEDRGGGVTHVTQLVAEGIGVLGAAFAERGAEDGQGAAPVVNGGAVDTGFGGGGGDIGARGKGLDGDSLFG
jgi:hypothetical protein